MIVTKTNIHTSKQIDSQQFYTIFYITIYYYLYQLLYYGCTVHTHTCIMNESIETNFTKNNLWNHPQKKNLNEK